MRLSGILFSCLALGTPLAKGQTITEFPAPAPYMIVAGPDGALWFTEGGANRVGRIALDGSVTEFAPYASDKPSYSWGITVGLDGALWFTTSGESSSIGRLTTSGALTEFPTAHLTGGIAAGPDGNLWFTKDATIGRITPSGSVTEFPLPPPGCRLMSIAAGPDGNLWFSGYSSSCIGKITPSGVTTMFPQPTVGISAIVAGPDGNLWFTHDEGIGKITPEGVVTVFTKMPGLSGPFQITPGPDGSLWFTAGGWRSVPGVTSNSIFFGCAQIGRITTSGLVSYFPIGPCGPFGITTTLGGIAAGPDGALWFAEFTGAKIGRITPTGGCPADMNSLCLNGRFRAQASFVRPQDGGSPAMALTLTSSTGAFWFFDAANLELVVKVLDGRSVNGKFWVFYGSLTNVEFTLTVTDTQTGAIKTYVNPAGQLASVADTSAF